MYFGGQPQCENTYCGWTYPAASQFCSENIGKNFTLIKVDSKQRNDKLANELGDYGLAWIGASCKNVSTPGGSVKSAWVWQADGSVVSESGFTNFASGVNPSTCKLGECLNMGGTSSDGKWRAGPCTGPVDVARRRESASLDTA